MAKLPKSDKWIAHVECGVCDHPDALVKLDKRQFTYVYCPSCKSGIPMRSDKGDRSIRARMRPIDRTAITSESHSLESSSHQRVRVTSAPPSLVSRHSLVTHPSVNDPPMSHPPPESPPPVSEQQGSPVAHSPDHGQASVLPKSPEAKIKNFWDIFQ